MYEFYGPYHLEVTAGLNSIDMKTLGLKTLKFANGDIVQYEIPNDTFQNTIFGTLNHIIHGNVKYEDKKNQIVVYMSIGETKKKPKDYFEGQMLVKG